MTLPHVGRAAASVVALGLLTFATTDVEARDVPVDSVASFVAAVEGAVAGDVITLAPGEYRVSSTKIRAGAVGTEDAPIVVRAGEPGDAVVVFDAADGVTEGFLVSGPHWHFENLEIRGECPTDSQCEHAFHIVGAADGTVVRTSRLVNFNAQIKGNGAGDGVNWPDDVLIELSEFYNDEIRQTSNPVTPIDIVGGRRWTVRRNFIHDFAKGEGNRISYAAFLKGNSRDGVFEQNLVACSLNHDGGVRVGLSFGGGGTGPDSVCEDATCSPEHQDGVMRNNIIATCSDVGIYVNEGARVRLLHNTLYATSGIDVRFEASSAEVRNNLLDARIRTRDAATITVDEGNVQLSSQDFESLFIDPPSLDFVYDGGGSFAATAGPLADVREDYCGVARGDDAVDPGALEVSAGDICDTSTPFAPFEAPMLPEDMGVEAQPDAGPTDTPDAGAPGNPGPATSDMGQGGADGGGTSFESSGEEGACATTGRRMAATPWLASLLMALGALLRMRNR